MIDLKGLSVSLLVACCCAFGPATTVLAVEADATGSGEQTSADEKTGLTIRQPGVDSEDVTLADLRDLGLCLVQVKQLSKNIYLEATRTPVPTRPHPDAYTPQPTVSVTNNGQPKYLEPRPEWLVFYVATLEPIIHLLSEDLKDVHSGARQLRVPKNTKDRFEKVLSNYNSGIAKLNEHLTRVHEEIGRPKNNQAIATEAAKMYQVAESLDRDRTQAFALIKGSRSESKRETVRAQAK